MKIALMADMHIGVRDDSPVFLDYFEKYYKKIIKDIKNRKISHLIIAGDLFDRRRYINFNTLSRARKFLFEPLRDNGIETTVILGNHDVAYKTTNKVNSPVELLGAYDNIKIIREPKIRTYGKRKIALIPWINKENEESSLKFLEDLDHGDVKVVIGHFELKDHEYSRGIRARHGMSFDVLRKFDVVLSGHYHCPSEVYLGAPYEMNWGDYGDSRGYYIMDTETLETEFIKNEDPMYHKIIVQNDEFDLEEITKKYTGKYVRVVFSAGVSEDTVSLITGKLNETNVADLSTVMEDETNTTEENTEISEEKSTLDFLNDSIQNLSDRYKKDILFGIVKTLYTEASQL